MRRGTTPRPWDECVGTRKVADLRKEQNDQAMFPIGNRMGKMPADEGRHQDAIPRRYCLFSPRSSIRNRNAFSSGGNSRGTSYLTFS